MGLFTPLVGLQLETFAKHRLANQSRLKTKQANLLGMRMRCIHPDPRAEEISSCFVKSLRPHQVASPMRVKHKSAFTKFSKAYSSPFSHSHAVYSCSYWVHAFCLTGGPVARQAFGVEKCKGPAMLCRCRCITVHQLDHGRAGALAMGLLTAGYRLSIRAFNIDQQKTRKKPPQPKCVDSIGVNESIHGFLRMMRAHGGTLRSSARL